MNNSWNVKTKRQLVLISAIVFIVLPPLVRLLTLGLPLYGVSQGHKILFWSIVKSLVSALFPVALIVAYLKWPLRLKPAYWLLPLYFGLEVIDGLMDAFVVRLRIPTSMAETALNLGAAGLPLLIAFLLWYYRPGHAPAEVPISNEELEAQPK